MNDELKPSTLESATEAMAAHATAMTASGDAEHPAAQEQFHLPVNMPADRSAMIERANAADDGCISAGAPSPRGQDTFVPGLWKCSTCGFVQQNQTLYVGNGSVGVSDEDATHPDLCPNDGLLMERVTWKEHAEEAVKSSLAWAERAIAAEKKLAASAHSALEAHAANAMTASGEAGDLRSVLLRIIDNYGPWHDDDCPGDDTCDCSCKPLSDEINRVLKASEASGEAERRVVEAAKVYVKAIRDTGIDDEEQSRRYGILEEAVDALAQPTPAEEKATEPTPDVWTASTDGEAYMGRFGSRDEAIADLGGRAGYVGTIQEIGPGDYASGHAELVIDNIVSQVEADISEAEGNPRRNRDDVKQLDAALTQVIEKWLDGRFDVSRVVNVEEIPAAQPTPAPSQDAEQTPVKGVDRG